MSLPFPLPNIGSIYDFKLFAPAILGSGFSKAKVAGLLDYESAMMLQDVAAQHAQVYPALPSGTPVDPAKLVYIKLVTSAGNTTVIAMNWLSTEPTSVDATTATVKFFNITLADLPRLAAMFKANGFNSFSFIE